MGIIVRFTDSASLVKAVLRQLKLWLKKENTIQPACDVLRGVFSSVAGDPQNLVALAEDLEDHCDGELSALLEGSNLVINHDSMFEFINGGAYLHVEPHGIFSLHSLHWPKKSGDDTSDTFIGDCTPTVFARCLEKVLTGEYRMYVMPTLEIVISLPKKAE